MLRRAAKGPATVALLLAAVLATAALAETGLPVPRFVSLRSGEVNLRTGPGTTYPVEWVYVRRHMPVEVVAEFEAWRKIRDWQGTVGWVHQSMLDGRRRALITGAERVIRHEPRPDAAPVARLAPGVVANLEACEIAWCRVEASGYRGWLPRDGFWGAYPGETFD